MAEVIIKNPHVIEIDLVTQVETDIIGNFLNYGDKLKQDIIQKAQEILQESGVDASNKLSESFEVDIDIDGKGFHVVLSNVAVDEDADKQIYYWEVLELGRTSFAESGKGAIEEHIPPAEAIRGWMDAKGGFTDVSEYVIARSIAEKGIDARPEIINLIRRETLEETMLVIGRS
jgi:hypothetical protein